MTLTLSALQKAFGKCADWTPADWMTALVGEVGEMANIMKKVRRGDFTFEAARKGLAHEIADIQGYLSLLAQSLGIDLEAATVEKFDIVSDRVGSPIKLDRPRQWTWMHSDGTPVDPTAQTEPLTKGQQIVANHENDMIAEPCELAEAIDKAIWDATRTLSMPPRVLPDLFTAKRRHQWGPSRVGHGEQQCVHCLITNREAAVVAPEFCI